MMRGPCSHGQYVIAVAITALAALMGGAALAHPHPGGIVVRADGTVLAGDILRSRVLVIEPSGERREIGGLGHVRELEQASNGTIYGVSQGSGIWQLGADERPIPLMPEFHGLFAVGEGGSMVLAPADAYDRRPRLEVRSADGRRTTLARLGQIEALVRHGRTVVVADSTAVRSVAPDGTVTTLAGAGGNGLHGLVMGPRGPIVAVYDARRVVELARNSTRRILLTSEPPWSPTDVTLHSGALYVLEIAQHPCCWKGPRIRRLVPGNAPVTLLIFDDGDHSFAKHWGWLVPWVVGGTTMLAAMLYGATLAARRVTTRRLGRARQRPERDGPEDPGGP